MYTNVASLMSKFDQLCIEVEKQKPKVILLTETWLNSEIPDSMVTINNYSLLRKDRQNRKGGGVAIYVEREPDDTPTTVTPIHDLSDDETETLWVELQLNQQTLTIGVIYRPPSNVVTENDIRILEQIKKANERKNTIMIFGDFNLPTLKWPHPTTNNTTPVAREFLNTLNNTSFTQLINEPTRHRTGQTPSTLDLIFTNDTDAFTMPTTHAPIGNSDHIVITIELQTSHHQSKQDNSPTSHRKNYWRANFENIKNNLRTLQFNDKTSLNETWLYFKNNTKRILDQHSPTYEKPSHRSKPWIKPHTLQTIKHKNKLWTLYRRTNSPLFYTEYKTLRNNINNTLQSDRKQYERNIARGKAKQLHAYIRHQISSTVEYPQALRINDQTITTDPTQIAEEFAKTFQKFNVIEPNDPLPHLDDVPGLHTLEDIDFQTQDIVDILSHLNTNSSSGPDTLPTILLKNCATELASPLHSIFRQSIDTGILPQDWKTATITPIFKKGDKLDANNYRPISLTSPVCKVMERLIADKLLSFAQQNNLIPPQQHGFVPNRSTTTNLLSTTQAWIKDLDSRKPTDVIYLDFAKAFDRVPHQRLLHKLHHFGIRGKILKWLESFLIGRTTRVKIGKHISSLHPVTSGVPQGSVLGPILFILYTSDIIVNSKTNFSIYADDTKIYTNPLENALDLQMDIDSVVEWTEKWLIPLNEAKCTILHIGKNNPHYQYNINGVNIQPTTWVKDLGVIITNDLKWEAHINNIVKKANRKLFLIRKAFRFLDETTFKTLFGTYILPILEYSSSVWSPYLTKDITLLEGVQRRATKMLQSLKNLPYEERLLKLNMSSLTLRRQRRDAVETYKILHGHYASPQLVDFYTKANTQNLRGHNLKLKKAKFKHINYKNTLSNRIVEHWNRLSQDIISAPSIQRFKSLYFGSL